MKPTRDEVVKGIANGLHDYLYSLMNGPNHPPEIFDYSFRIAVKEWLDSHKTEIIGAIAAYANQSSPGSKSKGSANRK